MSRTQSFSYIAFLDYKTQTETNFRKLYTKIDRLEIDKYWLKTDIKKFKNANYQLHIRLKLKKNKYTYPDDIIDIILKMLK